MMDEHTEDEVNWYPETTGKVAEELAVKHKPQKQSKRSRLIKEFMKRIENDSKKRRRP